jgi:hypothetical protein
VEEAKKEIVAAYQRSLDALRQVDADAALQIDTEDCVSITVGQKPRTRPEIEPFVRRDIASMKPPPSWNALWSPDFERSGTSSGIQIYELKLDEDSAPSCYAWLAVRRGRQSMENSTTCGEAHMFAIRGSRLMEFGNGGLTRS